MTEVLDMLSGYFAKLNDVPEGCHLFCPKVSDDDSESYYDPHAPSEISISEKEERIARGQARLEEVYNCSLVLGLGRESAASLLDEFETRCGSFLKTCPDCVRNWHRSRKSFLADIMMDYGDAAVVEQLKQRLNEFDFPRIQYGLIKAKEFIESYQGAVSQSIFLKEGREDLLICLYEAICCMPFLSLPENRPVFTFVFEKIQERKPLKLEEILPTMTFFLFEEDPVRRNFATQAFQKKPLITKPDFDWAIDESLSFAINKANNREAADTAFLQRFWQGVAYILDALDGELMVECLQGMTTKRPTVYQLLIDQISSISSVPVMKAMLEVFCVLIKKSPKAFWKAFEQWAPSAIFEGIIRSSAFVPFLMQSGEHDMTPSGPAAVAWISPFLDSVTPNQKTDVCDKLVRHLLGEIADHPRMTAEGRLACYRGAVEALASSLKGFLSKNYNLGSNLSTLYTNPLLNLVMKYKSLITEWVQLRGPDRQQTSLAHASLTVVGSALMLDSRITAIEWKTLVDNKNVLQEVKRDSSGLWEAFLETVQPREYEVAEVMLQAFKPLVSIEMFQPPREQHLPEPKRQFNDEFQKTTEVIGRMVERLEFFDQTALQRLSPEARHPFVATLIYGEESISQAGAFLIKGITSEERRTDAVRKLLDMDFAQVLAAYNDIVRDITMDGKSLWSPQYNILRYSREILDGLCNPTSGILRVRKLANGEQDALRNWWAEQWVFLDIAFCQTEFWSQMVDTKTMKLFCRDAMEHAEELLSHDGLLNSALTLEYSEVTGIDSSLSSMEQILEHPRMRCFGLCRMLRLKDVYLVSVIVNVLVKLLHRLSEYNIEIPGQPLTFIRNVITKDKDRFKIATNLSNRQRAELSKALGEEETKDDLTILSEKKTEVKKQTKLDEWSRNASDTSSAPANLKPVPKAPVAPAKTASSDEKTSVLDQMRVKPPAQKGLTTRPAPQNPELMRRQRAKAQEDKRRLDALNIAKARAALGVPKQTVAGEGSGLQGLSGIHGKDYAPTQKSDIMVNSSSEDEDESDDDAEFLARSGTTTRKPINDAKKGIQAMKLSKQQGPVKKMKIQRSSKDMRARLIPPMDVLHQAILEWDIFHEGHDPPNGITCSRVEDIYNDPVSYKRTFFPLLVNEAWRSFVTAKDEVTAKPFETKIINRMNVDKFIEVSTAMPKTGTKDRFLSEGDIVLLSHSSKPLEVKEELHCLARIWRIQFKSGTLEVQYRLSSKAGPIISTLMPQAEIYGIRITNMTTIEREYASLESLQYYDLAPEILSATPSPMLPLGNEAVDKVIRNYGLNTGQAKAVLHAKENDAFTLVQGPPGTGKTKTIIAMVGALLGPTLSAAPTGMPIKRPDGLPPGVSKGTAKKLLVCAPSNAAVDELVLRLKDGVKSMNGASHKINVLRLGRSEAINAAVRDVTLDELVKARVEGAEKQTTGPSSRELMHQEAGQIKKELGELRPQLESARERGDRAEANRLQLKFDQYKRRQTQIGAKIDADKDSGNTAARESEIRRRQIQQEILDSAQVLCATLSGSGHEMFKNLAVEFETVIIDEAAQCVELSALIPLKYGCSKCILVGDPKQLPPTVLSQSAARYGYDQSLFVRMQRASPQDVHLLDTQYRMHPAISSFPSQEFYERRLIDGNDMAKLRRQPWHQDDLLGPYRFFDVEGVQQQGQRGQSLVNTKEVDVAMQLYKRLSSEYGEVDLKGKIGIITPYKAQLFALRDRFSHFYGDKITEDIEFNTTDAFQGRECEIIVFSCVRASPTGGIGFMTDIRRMNVGLTRAKSSLWILGNSKALQQGEFWAKLIVDAKERKQYSAGNVLSMLAKPSSRPPQSSAGNGTLQTNQPSWQGQEKQPAEDVVMEDASAAEVAIPDRYKSHQLPSTYSLVKRASSGPAPTGFGGIDERGESAAIPRTGSERPVIHQSGNKRHREDSGAGNPAKRVAQGAVAHRPPPTGPRAAPRPQDPSAMAVLGIPPTPPPPPPPKQPSSAHGGSRPPGHKPKVHPPKKKPAKGTADMFIKRKPNKPNKQR